MQLYLVRHGQSTWNLEGRVQGQVVHPPLTALGRRQAQRAAVQLVDRGIGRIISSDLVRASQTAAIIGSELGMPVDHTPLLREQYLGTMEGVLSSDLTALPTPPGAHVSDIRWGGGESLADVAVRLTTLLDQLRAGPQLDTALVSHADALRVLLALVEGRTHREVEWLPIEHGQVIATTL